MAFLVAVMGLGGALVVNDANVAAQEFGTIMGFVYEEDQTTKITSGEVKAEDYDTGDFAGAASIQPNGSFYLVLEPGSYRLRASAPGYAAEWYDGATGTYKKEEALRVDLAADETITDVNFYLSPGGTISGKVTGQEEWGSRNLENISVGLADVTGGDGVPYLPFRTCTDHEGNFTIDGVPYGTYAVFATGAGGWCGGETWWMKQWYNLKDRWEDADPVTLDAEHPVREGIDFNLKRGATIEGHVRDKEGHDLQGTVFIEDFYTGEMILEIQTEPDGHFEAGGLPGGEFLVSATALGKALQYWTHWGNTFIKDEASPIHVGPGDWWCCAEFWLEDGGSVSGTVYNSDGSVIADADVGVEWQKDDEGWQWLRGTRSAADGSWRIKGLPEGFFRAFALASGYQREYYDGAQGVIDPEGAKKVAVMAGQDTGDIDFYLDPGAIIEGTVYGNGSPLEKISVGVAAATNGDNGVPYLPFGDCTNENGEFSIVGLPFGDYKLYATGGWWCGGDAAWMLQWYDHKDSWAAADVIHLDADNPVATDKDFDLERGGAIKGRLAKAEDGAVSWGGWVRVFKWDTGDLVAEAWADENGAYKVEGLPTDDYLVMAGAGHCWDWEQRARKFWQDVYSREAATPVHVEAPDTTKNIDFNLEMGGCIEGEARDWHTQEPLPNISIMAKRVSGGSEAIFRTCTEEDGRYLLQNIPLGGYKIRASGEGPCGGDPWYGPQWFDMKTTEAEADTIIISEEQRQQWAEFDLERCGAISGNVSEAGGGPIEGASIDAFHVWDDFQQWEHKGHAETDADGNYMLYIAEGEYLLRASAEGYVAVFYSDTSDPRQAQWVPVEEGSETEGIDFDLKPGAVISGTTYREDGQTPLPNVHVLAVALDMQAHYGTCSDENGEYELTVPHGSYKVMAEGYEPCGSDPRYATEWYPEATNWEGAQAITVPPDRTDIDFSLELGGSISGTVYEEAYDYWAATMPTPTLEGVSVIVRDAATGMFAGAAITEWDGKYKVEGLPSGEYQVTAWREEFHRSFYDNKTDWAEADLVTVEAPHDTSGKDFYLKRAPWENSISGEVDYIGTAVLHPEEHDIHILAMDMRMMEMRGEKGPEGPHRVIGGAGGGYEMRHVGIGPYMMFAWLDADDNGRPNPGDPYAFYGDPTPVIVSEDSPTHVWIDIDIDDEPKGVVKGEVAMQMRFPWDGATITIGEKTGTSSEDGSYTLTVTPGTHDVIISMDKYLPAKIPGVEVGEILLAGFMELPQAYLLLGDVDNSGAIDIVDIAHVAAYFGTPDGDLTGDEFTDIYDLVVVARNYALTESPLMPRGKIIIQGQAHDNTATVTGQLLDDSGMAVAGAEVHIYIYDAAGEQVGFATATTDANGEFEITVETSGSAAGGEVWGVSTYKDGADADESQVAVGSGPVTQAD
ncbi:MAG TPA: hypothetical protein G4O03_03695 [Dehalococcoidia bacterium]|nr:hypothetical protein [Dehalococcoidia bacterium]